MSCHLVFNRGVDTEKQSGGNVLIPKGLERVNWGQNGGTPDTPLILKDLRARARSFVRPSARNLLKTNRVTRVDLIWGVFGP